MPSSLDIFPREVMQQILSELFNASISEDLRINPMKTRFFCQSLDKILSLKSSKILGDLKYVVSKIEQDFNATVIHSPRRVELFIESESLPSQEPSSNLIVEDGEVSMDFKEKLVAWDYRNGDEFYFQKYGGIKWYGPGHTLSLDMPAYLLSFSYDLGLIRSLRKREKDRVMAYLRGQRKHKLMQAILQTANEHVVRLSPVL